MTRLNNTGENAMPAFGSTGQLISVFLKWMAVIGLMYVAFIFLRRWQFGGTNTQIKQLSVIERLSLSQKQAILLVKVGNRKLLLGATDQSISLITELAVGDEIPMELKSNDGNALEGGRGFNSVLQEKMTGNVGDLFGGTSKKKE
ncbi:MAG: flagellar biosynthetic protein FliO [Anaerolineaceae bacterium]